VRFRKNFAVLPKDEWTEDTIPFYEFMALSHDDRVGKIPFIWTLERDRTLKRMRCSNEMVILADDRLQYWHQLRELAGLDVPESVHDALSGEAEAEYDEKVEALRKDYEMKLAELKATYPRAIARRMAEGLLQIGDGNMTVADLLTRAEATRGLEPIGPTEMAFGGGGAAVAAPAAAGENGAGAPAAVTPAQDAAPAADAAPIAVEEEEEEEDFGTEAWIETMRCTSCNECTNLNPRLFSYNDDKQAYVKDVHAGTFAQLVQAAERCPAGIIHPGDPVNKKEKDLEKWVTRAEPFN